VAFLSRGEANSVPPRAPQLSADAASPPHRFIVSHERIYLRAGTIARAVRRPEYVAGVHQRTTSYFARSTSRRARWALRS